MNVTRKKQIFAETEEKYASALRAVKQRISISISEKKLNKATKDGAAMKLDRINYVTMLALSFDMSNIAPALDKALFTLSAINGEDFKRSAPTSIEKLASTYKNTRKKDITMNEKNITNKETAPAERKTSFHLRVSNETFEIIKKKADSYGLSVSNYVEFVISAFDIMDIAGKIDELNERIDALAERG